MTAEDQLDSFEAHRLLAALNRDEARAARRAELRDHFAVQASDEDIKEMMYGERDYRNCREVQYSRQQARYRHADAMLKAREVTP